MIETMKNSTTFMQGLFVMAVGIAGVFLVLIIFFVFIKLLGYLFPEENSIFDRVKRRFSRKVV